jgi:hypothetical protein
MFNQLNQLLNISSDLAFRSQFLPLISLKAAMCFLSIEDDNGQWSEVGHSCFNIRHNAETIGWCNASAILK